MWWLRAEVWKALQGQFCFDFRSGFEFWIIQSNVLILNISIVTKRTMITSKMMSKIKVHELTLSAPRSLFDANEASSASLEWAKRVPDFFSLSLECPKNNLSEISMFLTFLYGFSQNLAWKIPKKSCLLSWNYPCHSFFLAVSEMSEKRFFDWVTPGTPKKLQICIKKLQNDGSLH